MTMPPTSSEYLDLVIETSLMTNRLIRYDSDLAELIGVARSTLSQYRKGKSMSVLVAVKLAIVLDVEPMETISATMAHQAQTDTEKAFWLECYKQYKSL